MLLRTTKGGGKIHTYLVLCCSISRKESMTSGAKSCLPVVDNGDERYIWLHSNGDIECWLCRNVKLEVCEVAEHCRSSSHRSRAADDLAHPDAKRLDLASRSVERWRAEKARRESLPSGGSTPLQASSSGVDVPQSRRAAAALCETPPITKTVMVRLDRREVEPQSGGKSAGKGAPVEPLPSRKPWATPEAIAAVAELDAVTARVRAALAVGDTQASVMPEVFGTRAGQEVLAVCSHYMLTGLRRMSVDAAQAAVMAMVVRGLRLRTLRHVLHPCLVES